MTYQDMCRRCGKIFNHAIVDVHTCTPSEVWRAAMCEGIIEIRELIRDKAQNEMFSRHLFGNELIHYTDQLIKKYSGE